LTTFKGIEMGENISPDAIREELERILASHEFRSSKRSQDFLRYVVDHTLNGQSHELKERTIGMEVFGRSTDYDPSDDATVRVKAGDIRKRLGLYYAGKGAVDHLRIELPAGAYVPEFHSVAAGDIQAKSASRFGIDAVHEPIAPEPPAAVVPALAPRKRMHVSGAIMAVLLTVVVASLLMWHRSPPAETMVDAFWAPVLSGSAPVSVCAAFVPVYGLNRDPGIKTPPRVEDFVSLTDQFVGGGDLIATSRLTAMLTRMQRPYRVRVGSDVSLNDLRAAPAILVGYSYTRWQEISSQMRFVIDSSHAPIGITDNGQPTAWALPNLPADRRTNEDFAIVTRVFHPDTHAMLVELAGITQYGTDAAADLVTNSDLLAEALKGAPPAWKTKNLQLVLHVKVLSGAPSSPRVEAAHFW
jgi:hypothetical protein